MSEIHRRGSTPMSTIDVFQCPKEGVFLRSEGSRSGKTLGRLGVFLFYR